MKEALKRKQLLIVVTEMLINIVRLTWSRSGHQSTKWAVANNVSENDCKYIYFMSRPYNCSGPSQCKIPECKGLGKYAMVEVVIFFLFIDAIIFILAIQIQRVYESTTLSRTEYLSSIGSCATLCTQIGNGNC